MPDKPKKKMGRPTFAGMNRISCPITKERVERFLTVLAETGSKMAAARAATPWSTGQKGGYDTFRKYWERDEEFKEAVDDAYNSFLGRMNNAIVQRAFEPTLRPIFSQGEHVADEEKFDNQLLMRVAVRHQPEHWSPKQQIEHKGQITHGVMVVGALPATDEEWEEKYSRDQKAIDVESQEDKED